MSRRNDGFSHFGGKTYGLVQALATRAQEARPQEARAWEAKAQEARSRRPGPDMF